MSDNYRDGCSGRRYGKVLAWLMLALAIVCEKIGW